MWKSFTHMWKIFTHMWKIFTHIQQFELSYNFFFNSKWLYKNMKIQIVKDL